MKAARPPSIIDTLSLGFSIVNRRLWLLFIPIFLELSVSMAPRITAGPVVQQIVSFYKDSLQSVQQERGDNIGATDVRSTVKDVEEAAKSLSSFNLLSILLWQVPTFAGGALAILSASEDLQISTLWLMATIVVGLLVMGLIPASLYLTAIAAPIRGDSYAPEQFYARSRQNWVRLMGYYGLLAVVLSLIAIVAVVLLGLASLVSQGLTSFLTGLVFTLALLGVLYLFFADEAIVVGGAAPLEAARLSATLVYRNYWAALGLAVLTGVIMLGTHLVWQAISGSAPGAIVAMAGNAYISTGIAAAVMLFYKDRVPTIQSPAIISNSRTT